MSQRPTNNGFNKLQRLCSRKLIDQLFASGNRTLSAFPLRVVFMVVSPDVSDRHQVMMSVSKRLFKHAVDRNRAKRQMREAWRLNNDILLSSIPEGQNLVCAFIWTAHEAQTSDLVHSKMRNLLHRMAERMPK
ncbi:MAG: ribonuclease P protein component [Bacteroidaceae bacterium]|nr:ribonuclease P protein component [Bacteroidaceae bacterium]